MAEAVTSTELANALDPTKKSFRRDTHNLALSDQIQFSSIMRTFVDTTDQMMDVATAQSKVAQMDDHSKPADREDFRARVNEQRRASGRGNADNEDRRPDRLPERAKPVDKPRPASRETASDEPKPDVEAAANAPQTADAPQAATGKSFREDVLNSQQTIFAGSQSQTTETTTEPAQQVSRPQAAAEIAHGAQSILASALTDKNFSRVGEDLHEAVFTAPTTASNGNHAGAQIAANSLKDEQASDLANRLSGMGQFAVHVDAGNEAAKTRQTAVQSLNASLDMNAFDGLDGAAQPLLTDASKGMGDGTGPEQKALSHGSMPADRAAAATSPQDLAAIFGQAMRAQSAMAGAQNTMAGVDSATIKAADAIQAIGTAAPAGPSQLSQTAKANPTTAAHQPEKAQTPAEQIAVKIRQAIGEGADKINIKLNPHELGRVEVRLELSKDGAITATVLAERQETLDMLQKDARGLEKALNDAGLRTDATSLSFGLRGDGQRDVAQGRDRRNGSNTRNGERPDSRIEFADNAGLAAQNIAYQRSLGANRGVDIRV